MQRASVFAVTVLVLGAVGAHGAQRAADTARFAGKDEEVGLYDPKGEALRVAALGSHTLLADTLWVRTVLRFADTFANPSPERVDWFSRSLTATADLDPTWRTVYLYGGGFLRLFGRIDDSDAFYRRGMEAIPDDPFFPFSVGMNAYLHRDDRETAAAMLHRAAQMEKAPAWYAAAAAAFLEGEGERRAALQYVDEQLTSETRPEVRASLEKKKVQLLHEEFSDRLTEAKAEWERVTGEPLQDLEQLGTLPPDPHGGTWIVAPDGIVRSDVEDATVARRSRIDERSWLLRKISPDFPLSPGF